MRVTRILAGAALTAAAVVVPAVGAAALPGDQVQVFPDHATRFQQVTVSTSACGRLSPAARVIGDTTADGSFVLHRAPGSPFRYTGTFTVSGWAQPGLHTVSVRCTPTTSVTGHFYVVPRQHPHFPPQQPFPGHGDHGQPFPGHGDHGRPFPPFPPHTGGGGSIGTPSAGETAAGAGLLAAAAGGGVFLMRRRPRSARRA
jgi:hypothetical protein